MSELFGKNLTWLRETKNLKQAEMPDFTGVSRATWSDYERGKTEPDFNTLLRISEFFGVQTDELLKVNLKENSDNVHLIKNVPAAGKGKKVHPKVFPSVHPNGQKGEILADFTVNEPTEPYSHTPKVVTIDSSGRENILFVPVKARAGYLLGYGDPSFIEKLPAFSIPGLNHGSYRIFEVDGHSMFNTLHDKDKVICRWDTLAGIKDDRVYVLVTKSDGILVKRLINRHSEGVLICKSDNNYKGEYPAIVLNIQDIQEIWYVTDRWTKQLPSPGEIFKRVTDLEADVILLKQKLIKGT